MNASASASASSPSGTSSVGYRFWVGIGYLLLATGCGLGLSVEFQHIDENLEVLARERGSVLFKLVELARDWNAGHGGVYAPVTEKTQPNPYLTHPRRDLLTADGQQLTMINPAFMTRQIAEIAERASGVRYHITSLKPIRPANAPDEWEIKALRSFETGQKEVLELVEEGRGPVHRYMAPLLVKGPCLVCHAVQGYREGDIRGGISVTMPADSILAIRASQRERAVLQFGSVTLALGLLMHFVIRRSWLHFIRLQEIAAGQERLIGERTQALSTSNHLLQVEVDERKRKEVQILESEARYRSVIETSQSAILIVQPPEFNVVFANEQTSTLFGRPLEAIVDKPLLAFVHVQDSGAVADWLIRRLHGEPVLPVSRIRFVSPDGKVRVGDVHVAPIESPGQFQQWVFSVQDVTERLANERALMISSAVMENAAEGIVVTDAENRIIQVNPAFSAITGFPADRVLGKDPKMLSSGRHDAAFFRELWHTLDIEGHWAGEIWNRRPDGTIYVVWLSISLIRGEGSESGGRHVATFIDITRRKEVEDLLRHRAQSDPLTDLPNRLQFDDCLQLTWGQASRSGERFALFYLDLDHFKEVNDTQGHAAGDELLIETARRLMQVVRHSDTVARLGGDEFAVILPNIRDASEVEDVAERIVGVLARPFLLSTGMASVSASVGIALYPDHGLNPEQLRANADAALYAVKSAGRNDYRFCQVLAR